MLLRWLALYPCHNPPCLLFVPRALSARRARFRHAFKRARVHARASLCARARVRRRARCARRPRARRPHRKARARAACGADFAAAIWSSSSSSCDLVCLSSCVSLLSTNRNALASIRVDALPGANVSNTPCATNSSPIEFETPLIYSSATPTPSTCGLVAMTSAHHAEGHRFNPDQVYEVTSAMRASVSGLRAICRTALTN